MKILVSACLLGENCKYSGGNNYNQAVCDFARGHQVVPVCPEVLGGLPTPRCPAEIVQGVVTNKEGINVDREFRAGAAIGEFRLDIVVALFCKPLSYYLVGCLTVHVDPTKALLMYRHKVVFCFAFRVI